MRALTCIVYLMTTLLYIKLATCADCEVYGLKLKVGDTQTVPGKCSLVECNGQGYDAYTIKACPNAYSPPHCKFVPVNIGKTFPDCCPHWDC